VVVTVPDANLASSVIDAASALAADPTAASLGVSVEAMAAPTVAFDVSVPLVVAPPPSPTAPPPLLEGQCGGGCVAGIVGSCFVAVLLCALWLVGAFARHGCRSPLNMMAKKPRALVPLSSHGDIEISMVRAL